MLFKSAAKVQKKSQTYKFICDFLDESKKLLVIRLQPEDGVGFEGPGGERG